MKATSFSRQFTLGFPRVFHPMLLALLLIVLGGSNAFGTTQDVSTHAHSPEYRLPDNPGELLRIDNEMRAFFAARVDRNLPVEVKIDEITNAILGEKGMHFRYEAQGVYDVRETFRRRRGNCVSYALLLVAVAREFGLPAKFNEVFIHPRWQRTGGIVLVSRHINVRVPADDGFFELDIKFNDESRASSSSTSEADDARAFAGAYNCVGVFRLAAGDRAEALRLMEKATAIDPTYVPGWTNLGSALMMAGQLDRARICYERALALDRRDLAGISGLAVVHRRMGHNTEAEKLERTAIRYRERNPYYLLMIARGELAKGDLDAARRHLKRAINIKNDEPELYELMAEVARGQGLEAEAQRWRERSKRAAS